MTGLLLIDKPSGVTSHDVVDHVRRAARTRRVGHTGTLDPNATGLLIICIEKATRLSEHLTRLDKTYEGTMRLGIVTESYDLDSQVVEEKAVPDITLEEIQKLCDKFTGSIEQAPPMVSAVKVGGERLYKKARKGEVVERVARAVTVYEFSVLAYNAPDAIVRVRCTSGTYVRSLCHDVGQEIGCGAVLASLRRTAVGKHHVENATPMEQITSPEDVTSRLLSIDTALDMPEVVLREVRRSIINAGGSLTQLDLLNPCEVREGWVQIKSERGELLALGMIQPTAAGPRIQPKRVFVGND